MGAYLRRLVPRAWWVLWGPVSRFFTGSATVLTLIGFLEQPLRGSISNTWQGVPWWFGLVALIPLLFYAFVRTSYEEYRAVAVARAVGGTGTQSDRDRKLEQLESRALRAEQERDEFRSFLADTDAVERHEEQVLRRRSLNMAREVASFGQDIRYDRYDPDTVERFRRRHYGKVVAIRDELDRREWLTDEERESLTLSEGDRTDKIERMGNVLRSIGTGH